MKKLTLFLVLLVFAINADTEKKELDNTVQIQQTVDLAEIIFSCQKQIAELMREKMIDFQVEYWDQLDEIGKNYILDIKKYDEQLEKIFNEFVIKYLDEFMNKSMAIFEKELGKPFDQVEKKEFAQEFNKSFSQTVLLSFRESSLTYSIAYQRIQEKKKS